VTRGPSVTADDISNAIIKEQYHVFPGTTVTVCCLTLRNGYAVTGTSACAAAENFDGELGRGLAYADAKRQIWALEAYLLCEALHAEKPAVTRDLRQQVRDALREEKDAIRLQEARSRLRSYGTARWAR
jgi:hypothetical protein